MLFYFRESKNSNVKVLKSFQSHTRASALIPVDEDDAGAFQGLLDLEDVLD